MGCLNTIHRWKIYECRTDLPVRLIYTLLVLTVINEKRVEMIGAKVSGSGNRQMKNKALQLDHDILGSSATAPAKAACWPNTLPLALFRRTFSM